MGQTAPTPPDPEGWRFTLGAHPWCSPLALQAAPWEPHGSKGEVSPFSRRCLRMRSMTVVLVIQATITISSPHRLHTKGSTSNTFLSIRAHDELRRASAEPGVAGGGASVDGARSDSAGTSSSSCVGPSPANAALAPFDSRLSLRASSRRNFRFLHE